MWGKVPHFSLLKKGTEKGEKGNKSLVEPHDFGLEWDTFIWINSFSSHVYEQKKKYRYINNQKVYMCVCVCIRVYTHTYNAERQLGKMSNTTQSLKKFLWNLVFATKLTQLDTAMLNEISQPPKGKFMAFPWSVIIHRVQEI